jgi:hypothetical protein
MKKCNRCGEEYPETLDFFYRQKPVKSGLTGACKICLNISNKIYRKPNKEKIKERNKIYYAINKEKILKYQKEYFKENKPDPIKNRERQQRYIDKHKNDIVFKENRRKYIDKYQKSEKGILNIIKRTNSEITKKYKRDYMTNQREKMSDLIIAEYMHISVKELRKYPELIESKRIQIQIIRETKKLQNGKKRNQKC